MSKIIRIEGNSILIDLENGNYFNSNIIDLGFRPAVGDKVIVYQRNGKTVILKAKKRNSALLIIISLFFAIILSISLYQYGKHKEDVKERELEILNNMEAYLETRYKGEFIVDEPKLVGNEGFGYRSYISTAHPKDNLNIEFKVAWEIGEPGIYDDNYQNELWESQGKKAVGSLLKEIYKNEDFDLNFQFYYNNPALKENFNSLKELNYGDLINGHGPNLTCFIYLSIYLDEGFDKKIEAERAAKICNEYFDQYNIGSRFLFIYYIDKKYKSDYQTIMKEGLDSQIKERLRTEGILLNGLYLNQDLVNTSSENIFTRFEY